MANNDNKDTKGRKNIIYLVLLLTLILIVALASYTMLRKPAPNNQSPLNQTNPNQGQTGALPNQFTAPGGQNLSNPGAGIGNNLGIGTNISDVQRAKRISQQIMTLGNIKRVPVVIDGDRAIVGLQLIDNSNQGISKMISTIQNPNVRVTPSPDNLGITGGKVPGTPGTSVQITPGNQPVQNTTDIKTVIAQRIKAIDPTVKNVLITTDTSIVSRLQRLSDTLSKELNDVSSRIQAKEGLR